VIVVGVLAWAAIAAMAVIVATQLVGWSGTSVIVTLQAATPYALSLSVPIGVAAAIARCWPMVVASTAMTTALVVMSWPLRRRSGRTPRTGHGTITVFHGNLLYYNGRTAELARVVARLDADVLAFTEYTPTHAGGLYVSPLGADYPYRIEYPESTAGGSALWSRHALTELAAPSALYKSIAATVDVDGGVDVYVVHPPNPLENLGHWHDEIHGLERLVSGNDSRSIILGDFNATFWHPPFRRLLAAGWRDAHVLVGRGFSSSWPNDRRLLPPFLRLDHALVDNSLAITEVVDVDLPGSDHRGFVVSVEVSRAEPAG
jgi:endonuclease/exonuclease/phosphatase (EEP) superfamily protein YafD